MAPRETENNAYAKFWGDKQRTLWCVMVFSGVANCRWLTWRYLNALNKSALINFFQRPFWVG